MIRQEAWPWDVFIDDAGRPQCECAVCDFHRWLADNEPAELPFPRELSDDEKTTYEPKIVDGVRVGTLSRRHYTWAEMRWLWQRNYEAHLELFARRRRGGRGKLGRTRFHEWKTVG